MFDISKKYDFEIKEMEVDKDHIHMMVSSVPKISPLQIVRVLKQQSKIRIWKDRYKEMKKIYWHEKTLWTDGYFCSTIGEVSSETLKHYIQIKVDVLLHLQCCIVSKCKFYQELPLQHIHLWTFLLMFQYQYQ